MNSDYSSARYALRDMRNTDLLVFRFVAERGIIRGDHVLDLGCGAGRSTRFLADLGKLATGVDRRPEMVAEARRLDPAGSYEIVPRGNPLPMQDAAFDAVFSSWAILEEDAESEIIRILRECRRVVKTGGDVAIVTNTPEFYQGRWLSCRVDHPENKPPLQSGQRVRVTLMPEEVDVDDYFWSDADYRRFFAEAGLKVHGVHHPLGRSDDALPWQDELTTAPYVIYHLNR
ncbi:MAG TPA: class I SAM-dependent methyltransferase [Verrucomicrobiota bacterium]|nr:class I SAM-dependent methyltransferase [Verrucomicrobiota bacterium]